MAKQIDPIKKERYKKARLKGKGKGDALIEAGISKVSARHNQNRLSMAKLGDEELLREFKAENVTVKSVLSNLDYIEGLAIKKKDYSTAKECEIWKGKYLAMFTEKRIIEQHYIEPTLREEKLTRLRTLIIRPIQPVINKEDTNG